MYCIEIPKEIDKVTSFLYRIGIWNKGDERTARDTTIKLFYSICYLLFPISSIVAITNDHRDESIFSVEISLAATVLSMKFFYLIWRKKEILEMINRICVYSIEDREQFTLVNNKLKKLTKFVKFLFVILCATNFSVAVVLPIIQSDRKLFFKIAFPLDWKNNEIAYWMATGFIFVEATLSILAFTFSIVLWYLMLNCTLRYAVLGHRMANMGTISTSEATLEERKMTVEEKQNLFRRDLEAAVDSHQQTRDLTEQMTSFCSNLFFAQIVTSGICICCSTYCLAFNIAENLLEQLIHLVTLFYHLSEIFVIMNLGNEIRLCSDRLSYCLFESNWIDQPQATKKLIILFTELVKRPHEIVIGILYPLTLETFRRILKFAYNSFNILKNLK